LISRIVKIEVALVVNENPRPKIIVVSLVADVWMELWMTWKSYFFPVLIKLESYLSKFGFLSSFKALIGPVNDQFVQGNTILRGRCILRYPSLVRSRGSSEKVFFLMSGDITSSGVGSKIIG
jgi:hypothetical protein